MSDNPFNQVLNPGFEQGLFGWIATGDVVAESFAVCEGRMSALFGSGMGSLSQIDRARGRNGNYLFEFEAGATGGPNGSSLVATVTALDDNGQPIRTLATIVVPPGFLPVVTGATPTHCVRFSTFLKGVPFNTRFFEVRFTKTGAGGGGIILDHVLLAKFKIPKLA